MPLGNPSALEVVIARITSASAEAMAKAGCHVATAGVCIKWHAPQSSCVKPVLSEASV